MPKWKLKSRTCTTRECSLFDECSPQNFKTGEWCLNFTALQCYWSSSGYALCPIHTKFNLAPVYTNREIFETAYCFHTNRPCVHTTFGESAHRVASFRNRFKTLSTRFWVKEYAVEKNVPICVDAAYNRFSFSLRIQPFLLAPRR